MHLLFIIVREFVGSFAESFPFDSLFSFSFVFVFVASLYLRRLINISGVIGSSSIIYGSAAIES